MPKFVFLWTDLVLWLVVAACIVYAVHVRRSADLRATWRHVLQDTPAMCAAVALCVFIALALLDSIHFRQQLAAAPDAAADATVAYATRTISPLDALLHGAIEAREKTYSVPLAYWSFQREPAVVDGREVRLFPRLIHGGAHLQDPERDWKPDLFTRSLQGLLWGSSPRWH